MRRLLTLFVAASITLTSIVLSSSTTSFAAPKNSTSNQDPNIKVLPKKQRKPVTLPKTCDEKKKDCPKVTASENIQAIENCKIADQTADRNVSLGFPRPADAILGKASIKVLYMAFEFTDKKYPTKVYSKVKKEALETEAHFKRVSNGLVDLKFIFPEPKDWVKFPKPNSEYYEQIISGDTLINLVLDQGAHLNPQDYSAVFMRSPTDFQAKDIHGHRNLVLASLGKPVPRVYVAFGNPEGMDGFSHAMGHLLYNLEDTYNRDGQGRDFHPAGQWDAMSGDGEYFAWTMYLNGWFKDEQVDCLPYNVTSSTHLLTPISQLNGKKLVAVTGNPGELLMVEYRTGRVDQDLLSDGVCNTGHCWSNRFEGLVVYHLDTKINHLKGPFRVPDKYYSEPMRVGDRIAYKGFLIEFLAKGQAGAYVKISKG